MTGSRPPRAHRLGLKSLVRHLIKQSDTLFRARVYAWHRLGLSIRPRLRGSRRAGAVVKGAVRQVPRGRAEGHDGVVHRIADAFA